MRASDFITERKKKRKSKKRALGGYFYPGYSFYGSNDSSDAGGDGGGGGESMYESAIDDLVTKLPSLKKHDYDTIDLLVKQISKKHRISNRVLRDLFIKKFKATPDKWLSGKLDETDDNVDPNIADEVEKFALWAKDQLSLKKLPKIELSMDTEEAQDNHHTGGHVDGSDHIWVYAKNRNLVDILRTVFHELVHVRQGELNMIKPGSSYPGSPIEAMADVLAGKFIKIYGEQNHHIFQ